MTTQLTEIIELEDEGENSQVYEHNCTLCNQSCYYKGSDEAGSSSVWRSDLLTLLLDAFDIQVTSGLMFQEDTPLCSRCTFLIGSLKSVQSQLRAIQSAFNDIKSKIAFYAMACLRHSQVGDIYDFSPTDLSSGAGKTGMLRLLISKSWRKQYIPNGEDKEAGKVGRSVAAAPKAKYSSVDTSSTCKTTIMMATKATKTLGTPSAAKLKQATKAFKSTSVSAKEAVGKKGKKRVRRKKVVAQEKVQKEPEPAVVKGEEEIAMATNPVSTVSPVETSNEDKKIEKQSPSKPNPGPSDPPEEITLAMSPELFQKNGYARTEYKSDVESDKEEDPKASNNNNDDENDSDKSVSMSQLSPGERALIASTFGIINWPDKPGKIDASSKISKNNPTEDESSSDSLGSNQPGRSSTGSLAERLRGMRNEQGLYVCMFCSKEFRHKYPFRDHVKTHTGDAPTCDICRKVFPKHHNLMLHMRTHTGEKPYICEECGKGFADKSNLKVHMRAHTGERPYRCEFCNMGFVNSSRLVVHRRLHTGERPFQCASCDLSFCTKNQLQYHMKKTHVKNGSLYRCDQCSKTYMSAYSLKSHMKKVHDA